MTAPLSASAISHALDAGCRSLRIAPEVPRLGHQVEIHERIASTNDRVDELGNAGSPEGYAVFAETQTAGRGRGGNRWSAPPGRNLTFSVLLRPAWPLPQWPRIAHVTGLAVARAVEPWVERVPVLLKWPNDVHAGGRQPRRNPSGTQRRTRDTSPRSRDRSQCELHGRGFSTRARPKP